MTFAKDLEGVGSVPFCIPDLKIQFTLSSSFLSAEVNNRVLLCFLQNGEVIRVGDR